MRLIALAALVLLLAGVVTALRVRANWVEKKIAMAVTQPALSASPEPACHPDGPAIVIVGDSRISQWPMHLFGGMPVTNKGVAGETALQLTSRFARDVLACPPRSVLIAAGINDLIAASLAPDETAREIVARLPALLIALVDEAARAGAAVSVATVIPPARPDLVRRLVWSDSVRDYVADVNARLRAHTWPDAVTLLDFADALDARTTGVLPDLYRRDTLHINAAAYERLTRLLPFACQKPANGVLPPIRC